VEVLVAQVSDTHLLSDPDAWAWGQHPAGNLASVMEALPTVDAIVATGDIVDDGTIEAYRLADALTRRGAPHRFFIPGNHDDPAAMTAVFGESEDWRLVELSEHWALGLLNTQWIGHEAGYVPDDTLAQLRSSLGRVQKHVVLAMHHPPLSPCPQQDCGLVDSDRLLRVLRGGPVRLVLSGHVHQHFEASDAGITFLGAPSTSSQLRHGGDPHYTDTGEPPGALVVDLHDVGGIDHHIVMADASSSRVQ
jgi:3',5'-cyclic-AMP phosphodiesterase